MYFRHLFQVDFLYSVWKWRITNGTMKRNANSSLKDAASSVTTSLECLICKHDLPVMLTGQWSKAMEEPPKTRAERLRSSETNGFLRVVSCP